jgi:fructose-1,6-bisphosphatase/inositol monophosphatase family enzyme
MNVQQAVSDIKNFLLEAGSFALKNQKSAKTSFKDDDQIVTESDLAISKLAQTKLARWLEKPGHIMLDEESIDQAGTPQKVFANSEYQWALDPIDGTAGYAMGRDRWGISLGLLHKGMPLAGGIYMPAIHEMLLADENRAWRIENFETPNEKESILQCVGMPVNSQTFVESFRRSGVAWGEKRPKSKLWINTPESAVQGFFSTFVGQAASATVADGYGIWDAAASLAIAARAGFKMRSIDNGRECAGLSASDFKNDWNFAENWLICVDKNFDYISKALKGL